jgi:hypothetical protein
MIEGAKSLICACPEDGMLMEIFVCEVVLKNVLIHKECVLGRTFPMVANLIPYVLKGRIMTMESSVLVFVQSIVRKIGLRYQEVLVPLAVNFHLFACVSIQSDKKLNKK